MPADQDPLLACRGEFPILEQATYPVSSVGATGAWKRTSDCPAIVT
jgi:hypothetical protein